MIFVLIRFQWLAVHLCQNIVHRTGRHLVCCLSAWRHKTPFRARAGSAVTNRVHVRIARALQSWLNHQLVNTVRFQTANVFHKVWRFDTRRPHHQVGFNVFAIFGVQSAFVSAGDHRLGQYAYAQFG